MTSFLQAQAPKIAGQIAAHRAKLGKDLSAADLAAVDAILATVDFNGWSVLVGDVDPIMDEIVRDEAIAALAHVGIDVEARPEVLKIINEHALDYARARSAEMVGMRYDGLGRLVENPNAQWRITESTREFMRADVTTAVDEGWSNQRLAKALGDSYGFSDDRAMMIARTETSIAAKAGAMEGYRASGVVEGKVWLTADDDLVEEECQENADEGTIGLEDEFPNGDNPHPGCRCAIAPVVDFDMPNSK